MREAARTSELTRRMRYSTEGRRLYDACDGFLGSILLIEAEQRSSARSITMWSTVKDMDAAAKTPGYGETMQSLSTHFMGGPGNAPTLELWSIGDVHIPSSISITTKGTSTGPRGTEE